MLMAMDQPIPYPAVRSRMPKAAPRQRYPVITGTVAGTAARRAALRFFTMISCSSICNTHFASSFIRRVYRRKVPLSIPFQDIKKEPCGPFFMHYDKAALSPPSHLIRGCLRIFQRRLAIKGPYIFSGASTPMSFRPFFSTIRVSSASLRRAAATWGSSPRMRQAV